MDLSHAEKFIDQLPEFKTPEEVGDAFSDMIRPFGFFGASASELRHTPEGRVRAFAFVTWPCRRCEQYEGCGSPRHDPILGLAWLDWRPFDLNDTFAGCRSIQQRRALDAWVEQHSIADIFVVPEHFPGGEVGLCVCATVRKLDRPSERRALHFTSLHILWRCRQLVQGRDGAAPKKCPLSAREIECMRWAIEGKSDTDIGQIVGISPATAHFHIENVKKKLGVRTRVQATQIVVLRGYV